MHNELSAALLLVHYAKSSLITDRTPSQGSENNITAPLPSFSIRRQQESGAETLSPFNVAKTFILKQNSPLGSENVCDFIQWNFIASGKQTLCL